MAESSYILVTAARNEAEYIGQTLQSVIAQTCLPRRWLIVSDGSTDETDQMVLEAAATHPFIELLRVDADAERNFGSKAVAINTAYQRIGDLPHEFVGVLDADISFAPDYYEKMLHFFAENPQLGIAGGMLTDLVDGQQVVQRISIDWSVSGPVQMFRKACFCGIGGYLPLRGGIDAAAEVMARMNGWEVRTFPDVSVLHHRQTGRENHGTNGVFFHRGLEDYRLGYHPLFFLGRAILRIPEKPFFLGGLMMLCGYAWAALSGAEKKVPLDFIAFFRQEQMERIHAWWSLQKRKTG